MSNSWRSLPRFYGSVPSIKPLNNNNNKKDSFTLPDHSLVSKVSRKEKDKNSLCVIRTYYSHHYGYQWVWTLWHRGSSNSSNAHHTLSIISHQMWLYEASLTRIIFFLPLPYTHIPYTHTHTNMHRSRKGGSIRRQGRWRTAYQSVLNPIKRRNKGKDKLGGAI